MKKITNVRPVLIVALAMLVACAFAVSVAKSAKAKLVVAIVFFALFLILFVLRFALKIKVFALLAAVSLFVAFPFLVLHFKTVELNSYSKFNDKEILVSGKICETRIYNETTLFVALDSVMVKSEDSDFLKMNGKIAIYVSAENLNLTKFDVGRFIDAKGKFKFYSLESESVKDDAVKISMGRVATGRVRYFDITISDRFEPTLRDNVRRSVQEKLEKFGGDYSDIGYAMLFGDSYVIEDEILDTFRSTGIAHLLAVSGLHVSIIVFAISFILKKLHSPKILNIILIASLLGFYCYLCDFSFSVLRASMLAVFLLSVKSLGKPYDRLTGLSFVAIAILLFEPLALFNVSFVLSFSAVLSIILLMAPLSRLFNKFLYKKVADTLALVFAVQLGLFVTTMFFFGKFSVLNFFTNFISVPIASFAFMYLFFAILVSFVLPFAGVILNLFSYIMSVVVKFNFWVNSVNIVLNFENIKWLAVVGMLAVMFVVSDYVFVKKDTKVVTSVAILFVCTFCQLLFLI